MFKVLTLDGGGIRGYLSANILANLETLLNRADGRQVSIGQRFDLIAGTSTGGIIACALSVGMSAKEIGTFYETLMEELFTPVSEGIFEPKYSTDILRNRLEQILGDATLATVSTDLCVTSVDVENSAARFHKSGYFPRNATRLDEKLVDIALATSAAPSYFSLVDTLHSSRLCDGGMVANNPSLVALIDAMKLTDNRLDTIALISIGTGEQPNMPYDVQRLRDGGILEWMIDISPDTKAAQVVEGIQQRRSKIALGIDYMLSNKKVFDSKGSPLLELLMNAQSKLADEQTRFLLQQNYVRINPKLSIPIALDAVEKFESLKNLADLDEQQYEDALRLLR